MIIDWTSGAIDQQATALPMGVWNWTGVSPNATGAIDGRVQAVPSVRGQVRIVPSVDGEVGVVPSVAGRVEVHP